jgi:hypothetical protein
VKACLGLLLGVIAVCASTVGVVAQGTAQSSSCTDFQVYWEALVATVPDDAEGKDAFLEIADAGNLTQLTEETQAMALSFMNDWAVNIENVAPDLVPDSARLFHQDLVQDATGTAALMEFSEVADLATMFTFTPIGIYVLLIEEVETPATCDAA